MCLDLIIIGTLRTVIYSIPSSLSTVWGIEVSASLAFGVIRRSRKEIDLLYCMFRRISLRAFQHVSCMEPVPFVRGEQGSTGVRHLHVVASVVDVGLIGKALD